MLDLPEWSLFFGSHCTSTEFPLLDLSLSDLTLLDFPDDIVVFRPPLGDSSSRQNTIMSSGRSNNGRSKQLKTQQWKLGGRTMTIEEQ